MTYVLTVRTDQSYLELPADLLLGALFALVSVYQAS